MKGLIAAFLVVSGISYSLLNYSSPEENEFPLKTLDFQPVCSGTPGTYVDFTYYLERNNEEKINAMMKSGVCGFAKEGIGAKILEEGEGWVMAMINHEGKRYIVFTSRESFTTVDQLNFKGKKLDEDTAIKTLI